MHWSGQTGRVPPASKPCRSCGRRITWRKKWERDWDQVLYCSAGCRARGLTAADLRIQDLVLSLLTDTPRGVGEEDVARAVDAVEWRAQVELVRRAARRLVAEEEVEILQGGRVVDGSTTAGPLTFRRRR